MSNRFCSDGSLRLILMMKEPQDANQLKAKGVVEFLVDHQ